MNKLLILLSVVTFSSCYAKRSKSGVQAVTTTRPIWLKSPEAIEGTVTKAWGLSFTDAEKWKYLDAVYAVIGGTSVTEFSTIIDQPNELFILSLDNLSAVIATKLIDAQKKADTNGTTYLFDGLALSTDDSQNCFTDNAKPWCDYKDTVTTSYLTDSLADPNNLNVEQKKRLMHNIQDIGEFMLLAVDNTIVVPMANNRILPEYLMTEVFLKYLIEKGLSADTEAEAWTLVVHNILLSGAFYLEAPVSNGQ